MDAVTQSVRDLYEQFPYPSGPPVVRVGFDVRLLLSYGRRSRPREGPIQVLDAGCSRGVGLLACASLQPDVQFLGIDISRTGLKQAEEAAVEREIQNVRLQEVDLMTLDGLEPPEGGFDVIFSSGVVHHLSDPARGLKNLASVLAPHGVLSLMVYGDRTKFHHVARAVEAFVEDKLPLTEKLKLGRELVQVLARGTGEEPWAEAAGVDDVEFVDRYLHVQEASYDVAGLWKLIDESDLSFLRWANGSAWNLGDRLGTGDTKERFRKLDPLRQFQLLQEIRRPANLELCLCHADNGPRPPSALGDMEQAHFAVHPEIQFIITTRNTWGATRIEEIAVRPPTGDPVVLTPGPVAHSAYLLQGQNQPFTGKTLIDALTVAGFSPVEARQALLTLLQTDLVYEPHEIDVRPFVSE